MEVLAGISAETVTRTATLRVIEGIEARQGELLKGLGACARTACRHADHNEIRSRIVSNLMDIQAYKAGLPQPENTTEPTQETLPETVSIAIRPQDYDTAEAPLI